jgi:hypothetical protein
MQLTTTIRMLCEDDILSKKHHSSIRNTIFLLLMEGILVFLYLVTQHGGMANRDTLVIRPSSCKNILELLLIGYFPT